MSATVEEFDEAAKLIEEALDAADDLLSRLGVPYSLSLSMGGPEWGLLELEYGDDDL